MSTVSLRTRLLRACGPVLKVAMLSALASGLIVGCDCDKDERGANDVVVPPMIRNVPQSGEPPEAEQDEPAYVPDGTEAEWQAMSCAQACDRAQKDGAYLPVEIVSCEAPARAADGKLHLKCNWIVRKDCSQGRI